MKKPPVFEPNINTTLKLHEMMAEVQWNLEQETTAQGKIDKDNDVQADKQGLEATKEKPELSATVHHIRSKLAVSSFPDTKSHQAARKALQLALESESDVDSKHFLDKKV